MFHKQIVDLLRILPADLGNARGQIGHHVGIAREGGVHPGEILRIVGEMNADKRGAAISGDDAVKRLDEFLARWKLFGIPEPPGLVILEFSPALIALIEGEPECVWITDVNRDRQPQFAAPTPDGIEFPRLSGSWA